ncbi:MAG: endonuclease/exonuclease/phosphatase family protein [Marinifilaceae bacterium]
MMLYRLFCGMMLLLLFACSEKELVVMQLNVWQEGTMVEEGYEMLVNEIAHHKPDFVMLSEVRNYKGTRFCDRIVASLKDKGETYYSFYSYDSGLLSKYPIIDSCTIFPENGDHGSIYKLVCKVNKREVAVYTAHLDYQNCSYYMVRGYCGSTWKKLDAPITDIEMLLTNNIASQRDDAINAFIADANVEKAKGRLVLLGGDFNEPSHLDWTEKTANIADHNGVVIPWTVSTLLYDNGFVDSYREYFPCPVSHPGYTYPADCGGAEIKRLTWAPLADERERIDFIYYFPTAGLSLTDVAVYGPRGSIKNSIRAEEQTQDPFIMPLGEWPSDHKGVIARFKMR